MIPEVVFLEAETRWFEEPDPVEEDDDTQYTDDADAWRKGES